MNISRRENLIVTLLAAINFTHILDFVVMMPLGPTFMRVLQISAQEFAILVSAYTWSAAISGLLGSLIVDRFDRKRALMVAFLGFAVGTIACAFAPNFSGLLLARIVAGAFGGIVGSMVFSVLGDVIPYERRGLATGRISAAFSLASIVGVPTGLWLAQAWDWHAPFVAIGALAGVILIGVGWVFPPLRGHLVKDAADFSPRQAFKKNWLLVKHPSSRSALLFASTLTFSGFMVIPLLSPSLVHNVGLREADLPLTYLVGGAFTFFTSQWIGRLSDRFGKHVMFRTLGLISAPVLLLASALPPMPLTSALVASTLFMVFVSGRFVPAMAMVTAVPPPEQRGAFMSVYSCAHNAAGGLAAWMVGLIVTQPGGEGPLQNYPVAGAMAFAATLLAIFLSRRIVTQS